MRFSARRNPEPFRRLRTQRWNKTAIWRNLLLLILVGFLFTFLFSLR